MAANSTDFICKHCGDVIELDAANQHHCFTGRSIFNENNLLFAEGVENIFVAANDQVYTCRECGQIMVSVENVGLHQCFEGLDVQIDENNVAYAKQHTNGDKAKKAEWTTEKTLALIALYEANLHLIDNKKKKTKVWKAIQVGLQEMNIQVTENQVRWKINCLLDKYKECVDNNLRSGRAHKTFEFFDRLDEFLGPERMAAPDYTLSSKVPSKAGAAKSKESSKKTENSTSQTSREQNRSNVENAQASTSAASEDSAVGSKINPTKRGSGSKLARGKLELQNGFLQFMEGMRDREVQRNKKSEEALKLQKEKMELKQEMTDRRLKGKEKRHKEILSVEKKKLKLLAKFINKKGDISDSSDSDCEG